MSNDLNSDDVEVISTYVENLDREIGGGVPKGHIVLVAGTPGTMKSSFTYHMIHNNAIENGAMCLYLTLEESAKQLSKSMKKLGYTKEAENITFGDIPSLRESRRKSEANIDWLKLIERFIEKKLAGDAGDKIVVIDSLNALYNLCGLSDSRSDIFHFFQFLKSLNATTFLISEMTLDSPNYSHFDEDFLVDGIMHLGLQEIRDIGFQLRIVCVKMRQMPIGRNYHILDFKKGNFILTKVIRTE